MESGDTTGTTVTCPLSKFGEGVTFWAPNNPPNGNGGGMEQNCVSVSVFDPRYPDEANWIAQRCDLNASGRDSFVCMKPLNRDICKSNNNGSNGSVTFLL